MASGFVFYCAVSQWFPALPGRTRSRWVRALPGLLAKMDAICYTIPEKKKRRKKA